MVPFYGQGMNCGFEDVSHLSDILDKHVGTGETSNECLAAALQGNIYVVINGTAEYSDTRFADAHAMCDLALHNYEEMRSLVTKPTYRVRKFVEGWLHWFFPRSVIPLYTMVSFSRIPYAEVIRRWHAQSLWLWYGAWSGVGIGLGSIALLLVRKNFLK